MNESEIMNKLGDLVDKIIVCLIKKNMVSGVKFR